MRLQGKHVVVTGAASGIGRAAATLFAHEGAEVIAVDLDPAAVEAVAGDVDGVGVGRGAWPTRTSGTASWRPRARSTWPT